MRQDEQAGVGFGEHTAVDQPFQLRPQALDVAGFGAGAQRPVGVLGVESFAAGVNRARISW